jgi:hypothetical protein
MNNLKNNSSNIVDECVLNIFFDKNETEVCKNSIIGNKRSKFAVEFLNILNRLCKKQNHNFKCYLVEISNWFKAEGPMPRDGLFWKGSYKCVLKDCPMIYNASILESFKDKLDFSVKLSFKGSDCLIYK